MPEFLIQAWHFWQGDEFASEPLSRRRKTYRCSERLLDWAFLHRIRKFLRADSSAWILYLLCRCLTRWLYPTATILLPFVITAPCRVFMLDLSAAAMPVEIILASFFLRVPWTNAVYEHGGWMQHSVCIYTRHIWPVHLLCSASCNIPNEPFFNTSHILLGKKIFIDNIISIHPRSARKSCVWWHLKWTNGLWRHNLNPPGTPWESHTFGNAEAGVQTGTFFWNVLRAN